MFRLNWRWSMGIGKTVRRRGRRREVRSSAFCMVLICIPRGLMRWLAPPLAAWRGASVAAAMIGQALAQARSGDQARHQAIEQAHRDRVTLPGNATGDQRVKYRCMRRHAAGMSHTDTPTRPGPAGWPVIDARPLSACTSRS